MLANLFKKTNSTRGVSHPALRRLNQMDARSAVCTMVRTADGRDARAEVGPVSFYRRDNRLFIRDQALFLVPPAVSKVPFSGRGEVLNLQFQHNQTPYNMHCEVVQRVRFSERLLGGLEPREPIGYKICPLGNVNKEENRGTLRFAHVRGVKGPQVFPHFRFDLFVENVAFNGLAHETPPTIVPFPGDDTIPEALQGCNEPEEMVSFFQNILLTNPEHLRKVHVSRVTKETRTGATELVDLGYSDVLGLSGDLKHGQIHLRNQRVGKQVTKKPVLKFSEGDLVVVRFVGRGLIQGGDVHYRWQCRVRKCSLETVTLRPAGPIQKQTGLPAVVRDFCVSGVGLQNSPILESYLMNGETIPDDPDELLAAMMGKGVLMHFYPRLYYPGDVEMYKPNLPAAFSILGEVARGRIDTSKDKGRLASLGVYFRHDPVDFDPTTLDVTAWEPLRGLRENAYFKEIHRSLNGLLAYLENKQ
ncbi:MAG: hypothetical protein ACI8V2_000465 [Candidatus Latescibacterota bacterium]|jgi:hypothetical protein